MESANVPILKAQSFTNPRPEQETVQDLVLLGGGHAHVEVIRQLRMKPLPGVRVSLITVDAHTAYSGMLPGFIAGFYEYDECHIDLARLASLCNIQFIQAPATRIDPQANLVHLEGRQPIRYDVLSINVGISPSGQGVPGSLEFSTPVKPVSNFVQRLKKIKERHQASTQLLKIIVVGGGAGGVELTMAMHQLFNNSKHKTHGVHLRLLTRSKILPSHPAAARSKVLRIAKEKGVEITENAKVTEVEKSCVWLADGEALEFDECLWCTQAGAPDWLNKCNLPLDTKGFIKISESLQSEGGPENVFACGDVAGCDLHPRPKSGVFAVRQGPALAQNLRNFLEGQPLLPHIPQLTSLGLITTGDQYAIASKGWFCLEGAYLWRWKDRIDRSWMDKYGKDLEAMEMPAIESSVASDKESIAVLANAHMRCGGCGSKVGATVLSNALARIQQNSDLPEVQLGMSALDDAALTKPPPPGYLLVQTVDFFRTMINDAFRFGAISANHALSDCHAMGGQARTALAIVVVPFSRDSIAEETLFQMMSGAVSVLNKAGCSLVGGHSTEGSDLSLGFTINGDVHEDKVMTKSNAEPGHSIILTKPLGNGILLAAQMQGKARGRWVSDCIRHMQQSNMEAAQTLSEASCRCCTDVTGFGLLGHLKEVCSASQVKVSLDVDAIPLLEGVLECSNAGVSSSLLPANSRVSAWVKDVPNISTHPKWPTLLDPQTGGGLLATLPSNIAHTAVERLKEKGFEFAQIIGVVEEEVSLGEEPEPLIDFN